MVDSGRVGQSKGQDENLEKDLRVPPATQFTARKHGKKGQMRKSVGLGQASTSNPVLLSLHTSLPPFW